MLARRSNHRKTTREDVVAAEMETFPRSDAARRPLFCGRRFQPRPPFFPFFLYPRHRGQLHHQEDVRPQLRQLRPPGLAPAARAFDLARKFSSSASSRLRRLAYDRISGTIWREELLPEKWFTVGPVGSVGFVRKRPSALL